jgi:ferredoxin
MAYVVCEPCIGVKDKACVGVCPVDCFADKVYTDADGNSFDMLFINPDECIDCGLCEPECPVNAIYADSDVPAQWEAFIQRNAAAHGK